MDFGGQAGDFLLYYSVSLTAECSTIREYCQMEKMNRRPRARTPSPWRLNLTRIGSIKADSDTCNSLLFHIMRYPAAIAIGAEPDST